MNKKIKKLIEYNEKLTAKYEYNRDEKKAIFDLLSTSLMVDHIDYKKCLEILNSEEVENCKTLIDCNNGIFLSNFDNNELKAYILKSRSDVLKVFEELSIINDNDWLKFINVNKSNSYCQINKAIILYVRDRKNEAKTILINLAKKCDYLATLLLIGIGRISNDALIEAKYMLLYKRISTELYFENVDEQFENRFMIVKNNLLESDINEINSIKLSYSNEMNTIGFL